MKMLHELMKLKEKKGKGDMSEPHKQAKMKALKDLQSLASSMMAEPMKGAKKVEVSAPDNKGLKAGLEHAKEMLAKGGEVDPDSEESEESAEDMAHDALAEHGAKAGAGEESLAEEALEEEKEHEEMSPEELDAEIAKLKQLKEMKMKK